jgi:hypothetical protein
MVKLLALGSLELAYNTRLHARMNFDEAAAPERNPEQTQHNFKHSE